MGDDMKMVRYLVRITADIEVDIPETWDENADFHIEENGCPGTSCTGTALETLMEWSDNNCVCWACGRNGKSKILKRIGPVDESMGKANGTHRNYREEHMWDGDTDTLTAKELRAAVDVLRGDND